MNEWEISLEVEIEAEYVHSEPVWKETDASRVLELLIVPEKKRVSAN